MPQPPESVRIFFDTLQRIDAASVLDILLIALLIYAVLVWLKGTSGMSLVRGAAFIIVAGLALASLLNLTVVSWLLRNSALPVLVVVPIVFQPEIRRALERVGRTRVAPRRNRRASEPVLTALSEAWFGLSARRLGALMVVERETGLDDYIRSGTTVDAVPTVELIINIFWRNSPLHDGAMIVRDGRIAAAACRLPNSDATLPGHLGTRHRAGLGLSEQTDAVVLIVSEETGAISIAFNGELFAGLDPDRLRAQIRELAGQPEGAALRLVPRASEYVPGRSEAKPGRRRVRQ